MNSEFLSLCKVYKDYFPIGATVNDDQLKLHKELIKRQFNSITPENELKFVNTQAKEGIYTLDLPDRFVSFAEEHNMIVRGHTLIWHDQTPDWVFKDKQGRQASRDIVLERMKAHIKYIVSRYKNKIYCWDVVNEAIDDNDFYRNTKWHSIIGDDYIDKAFQFAHEADPKALLFYNDYNDVINTKRDKMYQLVKGLIERGVPIHGIGLQGHYGLYFPEISEIKKSIERFADLGLKIQITEMDISVFRWEDNRTDLIKPTTDMLNEQAERYDKIFSVFREYRDVISGVTLWGIADDYTWLDNFPVAGRKDWPLLFDDNERPKQAFNAITSF